MATASAPPIQITAGDSVSFTYEADDYPPTSGWTMSWRLVGAGVALTLTTTVSGNLFSVYAAPAATGALTVPSTGIACRLFGMVSNGTDRFQLYSADCFLAPNPATITGDTRGHAQRTYDAIKALLEGRATKDQQMYKIGDRELQRIPIPELLSLQDYYRVQAHREMDAEALAQGRKGRNRTILTRMARG
jgi:hypothetical protein